MTTAVTRPSAPPEIIDGAYYESHGYPHEAWTWLRRNAPVAWCEAPGHPPFWAITRYADVVRLSTDPRRFLNAPMLAVFPREQYEAESYPFRHLLNMDPPEHRTYRRMLSARFTPRAMQLLHARVDGVVEECLAALAERDEIDFVTDVSAIMPLAVIAEMLGIPREDRARFFHWTNLMIAGTDPEYRTDGAGTSEAVQTAFVELFGYFTAMVEARRRTPTDDMTSTLANTKLDGAWIPDFELLSYLTLLIVAGNETTRNAATGGMLELIERPEQLALLRARPALVDSAVEEIVRWTTPVNQFCRTSTEDIEIGGQHVRAGEPMCLFYASANRDEDVFEDPFAFRVDRDPNPHIAFGIGEHVCMGAHLARVELRALFSRLVARLDAVERCGDVARQRSSFVGGIKRLPVRVSCR